jgi:hypothetical protein
MIAMSATLAIVCMASPYIARRHLKKKHRRGGEPRLLRSLRSLDRLSGEWGGKTYPPVVFNVRLSLLFLRRHQRQAGAAAYLQGRNPSAAAQDQGAPLNPHASRTSEGHRSTRLTCLLGNDPRRPRQDGVAQRVEDMAKKHGIDFTSAMARVRKEQPALFNAFNAVRLPE